MGQQAHSLELTKMPMTQAGMLIRKPVADVFEAIANPESTKNFWFTRRNARPAGGQARSVGRGKCEEDSP
jgi:uncharacterized protein YndB with AHSA1/START domain